MSHWVVATLGCLLCRYDLNCHTGLFATLGLVESVPGGNWKGKEIKLLSSSELVPHWAVATLGYMLNCVFYYSMLVPHWAVRKS